MRQLLGYIFMPTFQFKLDLVTFDHRFRTFWTFCSFVHAVRKLNQWLDYGKKEYPCSEVPDVNQYSTDLKYFDYQIMEIIISGYTNKSTISKIAEKVYLTYFEKSKYSDQICNTSKYSSF